MSAICREENNNRRLPRCQTGRLPAATGQSEVLCMTTSGIQTQPQFCGRTCPWFDAVVNRPTQVLASLPSQAPPEGVSHTALVCTSETVPPPSTNVLSPSESCRPKGPFLPFYRLVSPMPLKAFSSASEVTASWNH